MELCAGMDVSLKETSICVVNEIGEIQCEGMMISEPEVIAGLDLPRFSGELFAHSRPAISNWTGLL